MQGFVDNPAYQDRAYYFIASLAVKIHGMCLDVAVTKQESCRPRSTQRLVPIMSGAPGHVPGVPWQNTASVQRSDALGSRTLWSEREQGDFGC